MLTDEEVKTLISFIPRTDEEKLKHCLMAFVLGLGWSARWIHTLLMDDVSLSGGYVVLRLRAKVRIVVLPQWVKQALRWYHETRPISLTPNPYFIRIEYQESVLLRLVNEHTERLLGRSVPTRQLWLIARNAAATPRKS